MFACIDFCIVTLRSERLLGQVNVTHGNACYLGDVRQVQF